MRNNPEPYKGSYHKNLQEIFENYQPAYGDDWDTILEELSGSDIVDRITKEYRETGCFEYPVITLPKRFNKKDKIWEPAIIGNGMHRIAAHHLMNEPKVLVIDHYPEITSLNYVNAYAEGLWAYMQETDDNGKIIRDNTEEVYEIYSWRHHGSNGNSWIKLEGAGMSNKIEDLWLCIEKPKHMPIMDELVEDMNNRAAGKWRILEATPDGFYE